MRAPSEIVAFLREAALACHWTVVPRWQAQAWLKAGGG